MIQVTAQTTTQNFLDFILIPALLYPTLFLFGSIFGSFFKVVVDRSRWLYEQELAPSSISDKASSFRHKIIRFVRKLFGQQTNENQKWHQGRSRCDHCHQLIPWYDNIPLLSYLFLGGRCRFCGKRISPSHPLAELLTGLVFCLAGYLSFSHPLLTLWPHPVALIFLLLALSTLWLIFLFDWQYLIIPDELVLCLTLLGLIRLAALSTSSLSWPVGLDLITAFSMFLVFLGLRYLPLALVKKEGMGWGDIKLIAPLTLVLGYQQAIVGVFCAFIIGGVWGIILLVAGKAKAGQMVSFGPLLVIGSMLGLVWGSQLWQFYWTLL